MDGSRDCVFHIWYLSVPVSCVSIDLRDPYWAHQDKDHHLSKVDLSKEDYDSKRNEGYITFRLLDPLDLHVLFSMLIYRQDPQLIINKPVGETYNIAELKEERHSEGKFR